MVTPDTIQAVGNSIIVRKIQSQPAETKTQGGIIVQSDPNENNGFALGEVLSVGDKVAQVKKGDHLIFRSAVSLGLPNGVKEPVLFRLEETYTQIVGIVGNSEDFKKAQKGQGL